MTQKGNENTIGIKTEMKIEETKNEVKQRKQEQGRPTKWK